MAVFRLSTKARKDLVDIWRYSAGRWSPDQADTYVSSLVKVLEQLAETPEIASRCDDIRQGYRRYLVGSHVIYFRIIGEAVSIVRVLHGRMDVRRRL